MSELSEAELLAPIDGESSLVDEFVFAQPTESTQSSGGLFEFGELAAPAPVAVAAPVDDFGFDFSAPVDAAPSIPESEFLGTTPSEQPVVEDFSFVEAEQPAAVSSPVKEQLQHPSPTTSPAPVLAAPSTATSSSSASSAKSKISLYTQAEPGLGAVDDSALREWNRKHQEQLNIKDQESIKRHKEVLAEAQDQIHKFFEERKSTTAARARQNRAAASSVLDSAPAPDQVWPNVATLCDLKETHRHNGSDVTRMRDVLVTLKN